jgi:hypothetical protein
MRIFVLYIQEGRHIFIRWNVSSWKSKLSSLFCGGTSFEFVVKEEEGADFSKGKLRDWIEITHGFA